MHFSPRCPYLKGHGGNALVIVLLSGIPFYLLGTTSSYHRFVPLPKLSTGRGPAFTNNNACPATLPRARNQKPKPGPTPTFIFEARFMPESQIYRMS